MAMPSWLYRPRPWGRQFQKEKKKGACNRQGTKRRTRIEIVDVLGDGLLVVTVAVAVVFVVAWKAGDVRGRVGVGVGGAAVVSSGVLPRVGVHPPCCASCRASSGA
jgi:hypothetical protein